MGEFHAPVGAPVLCAILKHDTSPDLNGNILQRRKALWALINLGENLRSFTTIPAEQRQNLLAGLKEEASSPNSARAGWSRTALYYLDKTALPSGDLPGIVKVDEALVATADADDRFLRKLTGMAFNFWDGEQVEATLLKLTKDMGRRSLVLVEEND